MLGLNAGINAYVLKLALEFLIAHFRKLRAGNCSVTLAQDAEFLCYGDRRVDMVARYHNGAYACLAALVDSGLHLRAHGVYHARKADKAEILLEFLGLGALGHFVPHAHRAGQNAQSLIGHGLVVFKYLGAVGFRHRNSLPVFEIVRAASDYHIGSALGILNNSARRSVQSAHHFSARVEGCFAAARVGFLKLCFIELKRICPGDERSLRRLAGDGAVLVYLGIAAQRHRLGKLALIFAEMIDNGHFVLRKGAGLIRAYDLRAAEGLNCRQAAYDGVALRHVGNADGQDHRNDGGKPLGYCSNSEGDGHHEGAEHDLEIKSARSYKLHSEYDHAYAEHEPCEHLAQLSELYLQRCLPVGGLRERIGNLAHLGIHTGCAHDHGAAAVNDRRAHICHVASVAEGNVPLAVGEVYDIYKLADRHGFARQGGLFDLQACIVYYPAVRGNCVARFKQHNVADNELLAVNGDYFPAAQHLGRCRRHLLQGFYRLFGLVLLINAQNSVHNDNEENDDNICKALALRYRKHAAYRRCRKQNDYHGICKLL